MTHRNRRAGGCLILVSVGVAAMATLGCGADEMTSNEDDVVRSTQALYNRSITILYDDFRQASFFQVSILARDQSNNALWGGSVNVGTMIRESDKFGTINWDIDHGGLVLNPAPYNWRVNIYDQNALPHQFTTVRVEVQATITGNCHFDYEVVDLSNSLFLHFDGQGGTWTNNCYRANFLHP